MKKNLYNLTSPQKSIWYTEQFFANTNINNICGTAIVYELLDFNILDRAINLVIKNNDIFRLQFIKDNGELKQYFKEYQSKKIDVIELNSIDDISILEQNLLSRVFNIEEELYEFKIFRVKNSEICGYMLNIHHIKSDAITLGLTCQKIMKEYLALINKSTCELNENAKYENYIKSEKEYFNSKKYDIDKTYWNEKYKTLPEIITIPSTKETSTSFSCNANRYTYIISKEKMNKIKDFCTKSKISVFNLFMGILSIYLYRVNNSSDFVIGTPILNRTNFNEKNTLGMFINVAPLRINIPNNLTVTELLSNIAIDSMALLRHQKYSYQSILEEIRKFNPSIPNLYNIVLSYQITKANIESDIKYETRWAFNNKCANDIDIHLFDLDNTGELNISYDFKIDKYDQQDIIDLNDRLNYIIEQILENSDLQIDDLEIITPTEKEKILNEFNNTKTDYPYEKTIPQIFEEQVILNPNKYAIFFENEKLTYTELNEKSNILANYLIQKGAKSGNIIGIFLDKSIETIISILAILKIQCTYLPLDIDYPKDRIEYMIKDSNAKFIISDPKYYSNLNLNDYFIDISSINNFNNNFKIDSHTNSNSMAYIMYTSGSTGKPKGVMISQKNIIRLVKNTNYIKFEPNDRMLQTGSLVFDACTFEIWGALLNGLQLYIIPKNKLLNVQLLSEYIKNNKITILWLTSPLFNQLSEKNPYMFKNIKYLLTGGDVLSPKHIYNVKEKNKKLTIINRIWSYRKYYILLLLSNN